GGAADVVGSEALEVGVLADLGREHDVVAAAGVERHQVAAFELVEAFASQSIAVLERIGVAEDDPRVCADGGALALGHPWGASGAVAVVRLFSRLVRGGAPAGTIGVAAASVGGGLGVAAVLEVVR
ncbi:acetyl-CoA C-acyltransferase, partial [Leifsonia shinshuensis]